MKECTKHGYCPADEDYIPYYDPCMYCLYFQEVTTNEAIDCGFSDPDRARDHKRNRKLRR